MRTVAKNFLIAGCKTLLGLTIISLFSFFAIMIRSKQVADDIWSRLGISEMNARQNIRTSFNAGYLSWYGAKNAKNILAGDRVAIVNDLVAYAKKYYNSPEFKNEYKKEQEKYKAPEKSVFPETAETIKARERDRLEKALKDAEAGLNSTNPKIKNGAPTRIENVKKEIAALDDPNNPRLKRMIDDMNRTNEYLEKDYRDRLLKFEQDHPKDPNVLLKKRLQQVLDITADVDYDAELKEVGKYRVFVNPLYEKKPGEWKLAFRAGKAATDAVRAAALQWLKEIK